MANTKVTGDVIANGTISTVHLADDAITAAKLDSTATGITFADLTVNNNATFAGNILIGNTVVNPASGFADQTGIGLKYSTTVPEVQISSDSTALQLGRTTTGGHGEVMAIRYASNTIHSFKTNSFEVGTNATFTGNIAFGDSHFIGDDADDNLLIQSSANENIIINSVDDLFLRTGGTTKLIVKNGGNVGIGRTSPVSILELGDDTPTLTMSDTGNNYNDGDVQAAVHLSGRWYSGTANPASDNYSDARIVLRKNSGDGTGGSSLAFETSANGAGGLTEAIRIDKSQNVGIGTDSPFNTLDIKHGTNNRAVFSDSSSYGDNVLIGLNDGGGEIGFGIAGSELSFYTNVTERMRIDVNGAVGIGRNTASYRLSLLSESSGTVQNGIYLSAGTGNSNHAFYVENQNGSAEHLAVRGDGQIRLNASSVGRILAGTTVDNTYDRLQVIGNAWIGGNSARGIRIADGGTYASVVGINQAISAYTGLELRASGTNGQLFLSTNANIGIGTTSPDYKLTVNGDVNNIFTYSTGVNDQPGFVAANNTTTGTSTNTLYNKLYGPNVSATLFGANIANYAFIGTEGSINNGILLGTITAKPLIIGTSNTERIHITSAGKVGIGVSNPQFEKLEVAGNIKANDVNGKFYTNAYSFSNADTYSDTVSVSGHCLYEYIIEVNPNSAGSGLYADYYYGKVGIGVGWNGSAVTQYIFQDADETAPRSLYPSGGGNLSITIRMIYSGGVYTELPQGTTCTIRFQGFGTSNYGIVYLRRLA